MLETRREKIVVLGGAPVIVLLFYLLLAGGGEAGKEEGVALAARPAAPAATARAAPPPPAAPSSPSGQAAMAPQEPAAAPTPDAGISLTGVLGTGRGGSAILSYPGGAQRLVPVGRDVLPGLTLREVRRDRILLSGPSGPAELAFGGTLAAEGSGATSLPSPQAAEAAAQAYVRAAEPKRVGGRVVGYRLRSAGDIPLLQRAGLQAGDVLLSVNGNAIDGQERLTAIPAEIAGSPSVEVEFERGGRKMRTRVAAQ
ncbi:MAG TPA: type II secretion system protein N [Allosphingosinicella sp.]|jgi:general secretion pathway protein C